MPVIVAVDTVHRSVAVDNSNPTAGAHGMLLALYDHIIAQLVLMSSVIRAHEDLCGACHDGDRHCGRWARCGV